MPSRLEEELAEAHGLAIAASELTAKVAALTDGSLRTVLEAMRADAEETRRRCRAVESPETLARANTLSERAADLAHVWFKAGTGPLEAWTFLAMAEAGEVAVWSALAALAPSAPLRELADWALPMQRRHLEAALDGVARLAGSARGA